MSQGILGMPHMVGRYTFLVLWSPPTETQAIIGLMGQKNIRVNVGNIFINKRFMLAVQLWICQLIFLKNSLVIDLHLITYCRHMHLDEPINQDHSMFLIFIAIYG